MKKAKREYHNLRHTRLYTIWDGIKQRCNNRNSSNYVKYGGRGITVCDEWAMAFTSFYNWATANGYQDNLTIDRINNNGNYEPSNCRWATITTQSRNTRVLSCHNTSGYRGVSFRKDTKKFSAYITLNNKKVTIGCFSEAKDAALAYNDYVIRNKLEHTLNVF
jgi:hypothetical protein